MSSARGRNRRGVGFGGVRLRDDDEGDIHAGNEVVGGGPSADGIQHEINRGTQVVGPQQQGRSGPRTGSDTGPHPGSANQGQNVVTGTGSGLLQPLNGPRPTNATPGSLHGVILEGHPVHRSAPIVSGFGLRAGYNGPRPSASGPPRSGIQRNGPDPAANGRQFGSAHLLVPGSEPFPEVLRNPQTYRPQLNGSSPHRNGNSHMPPAPRPNGNEGSQYLNGEFENGYVNYLNGNPQINPHNGPFAFGVDAFANGNVGAGFAGHQGGNIRGRGRGGARGRGHGGGRGRGAGRGLPQGHLSIDALLASDARRLMPVLHPARENGAFWFGSDNAPRRVIVAAIRRHFDGPWFNISSVPNETIIQWWGEFIQSFYWDQVYGADVYTEWHNITAARLRDMVSKAKRSPYRPDWISETIWDRMWEYWNSEEGQRRSRIAAANRLSDREGFGPHAHTAGSRSYARLREIIREREGVEPSFWRLLRETHRKPDGTYSDARVESIDQAMQLEIDATIAASLVTDAGNVEDPASVITQIDEDNIYLKIVPAASNGRVFGLGGIQPIRERGESSAMAATRINLEHQVKTLQEQLAIVMEDVKRFKADRDASLSATPPTQGTMASANGPARNSSDEVEGAGLLYDVAREMADGIEGNNGLDRHLDDIDEPGGAGQFGPDLG